MQDKETRNLSCKSSGKQEHMQAREMNRERKRSGNKQAEIIKVPGSLFVMVIQERTDL